MTQDSFEPVLAAFPGERSYLLPMMLAVQDAEGCLSEAALVAIARHAHVPESVVWGVATSYSELRFSPPLANTVEICSGLSCLLAGAAALRDGLPAGWGAEERPCRFRCADAPVAAVRGAPVLRATADRLARAVDAGAEPIPEREVRPPRAGEVRRLLARCGRVDPEGIDDALALGAYDGLRRAREMSPDEVVAAVDAATLVGRGGAYFPAARKWQAARRHGLPRYLVVNAEEGEPGVFKDRYLMELDPHLVVEGIAIAAHAVEAERVFVYVNGEATLAAGRIARAIDAARARGLVDTSGWELRRGAGGYVCGEESVILSSIEGDRAEPRLRPPFPVDAGLWGRPTVINNVETLANLPGILRDGPEAFRSAGTADYPGTKLLCISGAVRAPGVYEAPFGTTLRHAIDVIAGGAAPGATQRAAVCGGPSGGLLPPSLWDVALAPGRLDEGGAVLGAGGIVVLDDSITIADTVRHLLAYNAAESCGKCTPCREGTARMVHLLDAGGDVTLELDGLAEAVAVASLCGLGQMAPGPYRSARLHFGDELLRERVS